ncbi:MAG TPA: FMN-binding negative transcriptional regulator [Chiayiivirga sp.]|nr:FMN-binding negative transcriptional regulator [Chiayiivirga sp.]
MFLPRAFAQTDLTKLDDLVARNPFVTLITTDGDGLPFVTHLPMLYHRDGGQVLIEGHWAKANPQSRHTSPALMIVHGPHTYISASWYPDKEEAARVPTWNYAVAHLHGTLEPVEDQASLIDLLTRTSNHFEACVGQSWRFEPEQEAQRQQVAGIRGFRFVPARIEMKFKLNQNHPATNREAVSNALDLIGGENATAIAAWMRSNSH